MMKKKNTHWTKILIFKSPARPQLIRMWGCESGSSLGQPACAWLEMGGLSCWLFCVLFSLITSDQCAVFSGFFSFNEERLKYPLWLKSGTGAGWEVGQASLLEDNWTPMYVRSKRPPTEFPGSLKRSGDQVLPQLVLAPWSVKSDHKTFQVMWSKMFVYTSNMWWKQHQTKISLFDWKWKICLQLLLCSVTSIGLR